MKVYKRDGAKFYAIGFLLLFAIFFIMAFASEVLSARKTKEAGRLLKKVTISSIRSIGGWEQPLFL